MPGRSLVASSEGIDKAKKALQRCNLTQTAIAKELAIASWSTVNKFFNGKPVDRAIFMEICFQLNLDWQEIAGTLDDVNVETESESYEDVKHVESIIEEAFTKATPVSVDLEILWSNARRTRQALNPYILPTIRREKLLDKCLTQIQVGLDGKKRVLPILGAAGYGKSTILGTIYDELSRNCLETNTGWVALARCDDLVESAENFPKELGEKVSDRALSITEIAQQLAETKGRGVLLLDTLDIVLTKPLVSVFRLMVSQLLDCGTTVVFTCRDNDYASFFEPYHESFAGFREAVYDGCKVPQFSESEVAEAAQNFASLKPDYPTEESQVAFATKILALSADSVSLSEIVCNPLLLALLCELFAEAEIVPEDLTVSQLYEIYWQWKISKSRHAQQSLRIGKAKEKLCLFLAETLYQKSTDRLRDFVYETSFDLADETDFAAYTALRSDGILKDLGNSRISFFHQTFLEYAIARWLNVTETGELTKSQIRRQLEVNHPTELPNYTWPIFRQLLTLVELTEFYQVKNSLDLQELLPFRAIAFAAVSRIEPESSQVLLDLFEIASTSEYGFTEALLIAANSAPKRHGETVWQIIIKILAVIGQELINKAIEMTVDLIGRDEKITEKFTQAVRALSSNSLMQQTSENRHLFWGKFLKAFYRNIRQKEKNIDNEVLEIIKQQYADFGSNVRAIAIDLYLTSGVTEIVQRDFLLTILEIPAANNSFVEQENAIELLSRLLPSLLESGQSVFGTSWLTALDAPLSREWLSVTAAVVGQKSVTDRHLMAEIIAALFDESLPDTSKLFNRSSTIALQAAIQNGGGYNLTTLLLNRSIDQIPKNRISTLATILRNLTDVVEVTQTSLKKRDFSDVNEEMIVKIAEWLSPIIYQYPVELVQVMDALCIKSSQVREMLADLLAPLLNSLESKQANQVLKKLTWIPFSLENYLQQNSQSKEARIALLKLYHQQVQTGSQKPLIEIVRLCGDVSQDVAKEASWKVLELSVAQKIIPVTSLLPILSQAKLIGVRQNCLQAIIEQVNAKSVSPEEIVQVFEAIAHENAPEVLQLAYKLVTTAIWNHPSGDRYLELPIADAVFSLTRSIVNTASPMTLDMITNVAFISFNQMVLLEDKRFISGLIECTRLLLNSVDIRGKIDNLVITGLLNNLAKFEPQFLEAIVQEDVLNSAKLSPVANLQALVVAISHNQGKMSPLLDLMLQNEKVPHETKSRILRERNL